MSGGGRQYGARQYKARQYGAPLAAYYDALNAGIDYAGWCRSICDVFAKCGVPEGGLVLDLACGTGSMTLELAKRGYEVIAADSSPEMLSAAASRAFGENFPDGAKRPLFLEQDMRALDLYGTVDAAVCCLDSVNYLLSTAELDACFRGVANFLNPGGVFIFDVNTPYKFKSVYAGRDYILESEGVFCAWANRFDERSGICEFDLTVFAEDSGGLYNRYEETQRERMYSGRTLRARLAAAGLEVLAVRGGVGAELPESGGTHPAENPAGIKKLPQDCERWHFICTKPRKPKNISQNP